MESIPLNQAKERLDELVHRASQGEDIVIADHNGDRVRLQPVANIEQPKAKRVPGRWKGRIQIPDDQLLEPLTEEELAWLSGENSP